jgi:hypothetical protein
MSKKLAMLGEAVSTCKRTLSRVGVSLDFRFHLTQATQSARQECAHAGRWPRFIKFQKATIRFCAIKFL